MEVDDSHPKKIENMILDNKKLELKYEKTIYDFRNRLIISQ